jgi:hypothetical protein
VTDKDDINQVFRRNIIRTDFHASQLDYIMFLDQRILAHIRYVWLDDNIEDLGRIDALPTHLFTFSKHQFLFLEQSFDIV